MEDTVVNTVLANPLPGLLISTMIRFGLLLAVAWFTVPWPRDDFPVLLLWVGLAALAGVLVAAFVAPLVTTSVLVTAILRAVAEIAVLLVMLSRRHLPENTWLSLIPAYIAVIALAEYFLFH